MGSAASRFGTSTWPARATPSARTTIPRRTSSRRSCAAVEAGRPVTLFGDDYPTRDGTCVRDYIHVADLADAHLRALEATAPDDPRTSDGLLACNLGNGDGSSNREVIAAAERVVGQPIAFEVGPRRPGDPATLVASAERATSVLGWRPQRPALDEMVGSAWAWRRSHPDGYGD